MNLEDRCIFDTNAVVSTAIFSRSVPAQAFFYVLEFGAVLFSPDTLQELNDVLARKKFDKYVDLDDRKRFLAAVVEIGVMVGTTETIRICRDPRDDKFLELAVSGTATCIVSGDQDLLVLHPFRGIPILTPTQFLAAIAPDSA